MNDATPARNDRPREPSRSPFVGAHGVLRNKLGISDFEQLRRVEKDLANAQMDKIAAGHGPPRTFDRTHLAALHKQIFEPIYEWAGHMRDERTVVDGRLIEPVETLKKGDRQFANASDIDQLLARAVEPLKDRQALHPVDGFVNRAEAILVALNDIHPFREGNSRALRAFIQELGRETGHDVRFEAITRTRLIDAVVALRKNPASDAIRHLVRDATDPISAAALVETLAMLARSGIDAQTFHARSARLNEEITGKVAYMDDKAAHVVAGGQMVLVDPRDIPAARSVTREVQCIARHALGTP